MLKVVRAPKLDERFRGFGYQTAAVEALKDQPFGAIFHEQGLGKTKIALDLGLHWLRRDEVDCLLVITKKGLVQNWRTEVRQHTFLEPRILDQDRRGNFYGLNSPARIFIAHYEVVRSEAKRLALFLRTRRVAVFLDESQKIKNPDSVITGALFELAPLFARRVIMTGTPVANRPFDIWAQVYFLDSGASLGKSFPQFKADLDLSNDLWRDQSKAEVFEQQLAGLYDRIRPFAVRETKASSGIALPDKHLRNLLVDLEPRQEEIYRNYREEMAAVVVRKGKAVLDNADEMLKRLTRLVEVASNPRLVDDAYHEVPGKSPALRRLLEDVVDEGEKAIVWSSFTDNVDWLTREYEEWGCVKVHGKMAIADRNRAISAFKADKERRILVATPGAAKEGLTLTVANHAIFYDRSFSLDDYLQAQDRIHRISQERPCFVTNLVARDTIDEWIDLLVNAKHLAARLAQGDITQSEYKESASYTFGEIIQNVLGIEES